MTYDEFKKLKPGDHVLITSCGMDSGTECKISAAKYSDSIGPTYALEPIDPYRTFVCGNGAGTRRKIIRSCGAIRPIDPVVEDGWITEADY